MADLSLDELIRRRGLNNGVRGTKTSSLRGGTVGRSFDAREKIGSSDVRQRLGGSGTAFQVKDAREKIIRKDARLQIRGGVVGGAVQDAREMINSRKQHGQKQLNSTLQVPEPSQVSLQTQCNISTTKKFLTVSPHLQGLRTKKTMALQQGSGPKKVADARDRLSLKRTLTNVPSPESLSSIKITKTIQRPVALTSAVRVNVPGRSEKSSTNGSLFSGPITKVVQNDSYTAAPPPPLPLPVPSVSAVSPQADPCPAPDLLPVSRTLVMNKAQQGDSEDTRSSRTAVQPTFSPLEGTKMTVNNLHSRVTEEDIVELFCVCGALKRTRLLGVGVAEVVFVRKEDAVSAYKKYNNRCLDGQPMKCNLHIQGNLITSDQPILLRLSDSPGSSSGGGTKKEGLPPSLSRSARPSSQPSTEVDPQTILKALFKSSLPVPPSSESGGTQATAFCIKI